MSVEDSWDSLGGLDPNLTPTERRELNKANTVEVYQSALAKREQADAVIKSCIAELVDGLTPQPDEATSFEVGENVVTVAWGSRWKWDQDKLKEILGANFDPSALPVFVESKIGISKSKFTAQDPAVQRDFLPALTTEATSPKITIAKKGEGS